MRFVVHLTATIGMLLLFGIVSFAQELPTSTPVQIRLASVTPVPLDVEDTPVFSISADTATPSDLILFEPLSEANVRSSPDVAADNQLGQIQQGQRYVVLGQYFNWIQFQYDLSPNQRAWVYRDLVQIIGDESAIPTINLDVTPTLDTLNSAATQTREAILSQEGGFLTVTAQARIIELPAGGDSTTLPNQFLNLEGEFVTPKPTFTYPPGISPQAPVALASVPQQPEEVVLIVSTAPDSAYSPILLIGLFGGLGLLGLLYTLFRS